MSCSEGHVLAARLRGSRGARSLHLGGGCPGDAAWREHAADPRSSGQLQCGWHPTASDARGLGAHGAGEELFQHCGQLQKETGIFAAGDLSRVTLKSLAQEAQENLKDVTFRGVKAEQRFCVIASHAAVFAFGVQKQADFLCDPFSALRRLRKLKSFLKLMDRVLTPKLHAKSVC